MKNLSVLMLGVLMLSIGMVSAVSTCNNDGVLDFGESCDNGVANHPVGSMDPVWDFLQGNGDRTYCSTDCNTFFVAGTWCGDDMVDSSNEECDGEYGCLSDCTLADFEAPVISGITHDPLYPSCDDDVEVCVNVEDESDILEVLLHYISDGYSIDREMFFEGDIRYCRTISAASEEPFDGLEIMYSVYAEDEFGNSDWEPVEGYEFFTYDCAVPIAEANGPYSCDEAGTVDLSSAGSYDVASGIETYFWSVSGNANLDDASLANPTLTCLDGYEGVVVTLTVTDYSGKSGSDTADVTVNNVDPVARIAAASCDEGETITLDAGASSDIAGSYDPLTFAWDLDDSGVFVAGSSSASYTCGNGPASEIACVQVDDGDDGVDETCVKIVVNNVDPIASSNGPYSCDEGETVTLTASATDFPEDVLTYVWTVDEVVYFAGESVDYFCADGYDLVDASVAVSDGDGGSDSDDTTVEIANLAPWNVFAGDDVNAVVFTESVCFDGVAMDVAADYPSLSYEWDFGDSDSDFGEHICHSYDARGSYAVTLTVTDKDGGSNSDDLIVTVYDYKIVLDKGWNLISIPLVPEEDDSSVEAVLADVAEDVEVIWAYTWDETEGKNVWTKHRVTSGVFDSAASLKNIIPGYGYYVFMAEDRELYMNGEISYMIGGEDQTLPVMGMPPSVTLAMNSWNLVGKYGFSDAPMFFDLISLSVAGTMPWESTYYDIAYDEDGSHPFFFIPTDGYWLSAKLVAGASTIEYKANYDQYDGDICGYYSGIGPGCYIA